jgi:hypothetical protein
LIILVVCRGYFDNFGCLSWLFWLFWLFVVVILIILVVCRGYFDYFGCLSWLFRLFWLFVVVILIILVVCRDYFDYFGCLSWLFWLLMVVWKVNSVRRMYGWLVNNEFEGGVEGGGGQVICDTIPAFVSKSWGKLREISFRNAVSGPAFQSVTSWLQRRKAEHSTSTFVCMAWCSGVGFLFLFFCFGENGFGWLSTKQYFLYTLPRLHAHNVFRYYRNNIFRIFTKYRRNAFGLQSPFEIKPKLNLKIKN